MHSMADKLFDTPETDASPVEAQPAPVDESPDQEATVTVALNPDGPLDSSVKQYVSVPGFDEIELSGTGTAKVTPLHADSLLQTNFVVTK